MLMSGPCPFETIIMNAGGWVHLKERGSRD